MNDTVVFYNGERVSVPKEVAEFLEKDRKRAQAQARQDKRHLSRSEFETVLSSHVSAGRPLEQSVLWNLRLPRATCFTSAWRTATAASGTAGISGATDTNFVLRKSRRGSNSATLYCTGRDIEYRELLLEFDGTEHIWKLAEDSVDQPARPQEELVFSLSEFLNQRRCFTGTATELAGELDEFVGEQYKPNVLMKKLLRCQQ